MLFSRTQPRCNETDYIDRIFGHLSAFLKQTTVSEYHQYIDLLEKRDHFAFLTIFARKLDLNIVFVEIDEIEEYVHNMPVIYEWKEIGKDIESLFEIGITPFARSVPDVAFVEIALCILSFKLGQLPIEVPIEIWGDLVQRRQFLVVCSICFGLGVFFLERYWIRAQYKFSGDISGYNLKYYVPLDLNFAIYSTASYAIGQQDDVIKMIKDQFRILDKDISKEFHVCLKFLEKRYKKSN